MNILDLDKHYLIPALEKAYISYLSNHYKSDGYQVSNNYEFSQGIVVDLFIQKDSEKKIIELKFFHNQNEKNQKIIRLKRILELMNEKVQFELIFIEIPSKKKIQIERIETTIYNFLISNELDSELDLLSTHTRIEDVTYIDINEIYIDDEIRVKGEGSLDISLQWGSDGDQDRDMGKINHDSIDFTFEALMNHNFSILEFYPKFDTTEYNSLSD